MLKLSLSLIAFTCLAVAGAASAAPPPTLPTLADCVRGDTAVCTFRLVRDSDLLMGGRAVLAAPAGMPKIDHVELRRIDDGLMVLLEYFAPDPALHGAAF